MKTHLKAIAPSLAAIILFSLSSANAVADDCTFGDCHLVREAAREQKEFLDGFRGKSDHAEADAEVARASDARAAREAQKLKEARLAWEKKEAEAAAKDAALAKVDAKPKTSPAARAPAKSPAKPQAVAAKEVKKGA